MTVLDTPPHARPVDATDRLDATIPVGATELADVRDPAVLLDHAWAMEPGLRLSERFAALDRVGELLETGSAPAPPPGRSWQMELLAERAVDAAAYLRLSDAITLAETVLSDAPPAARIARARATLARGRALVWQGTDEARLQGDRVLEVAAEQFRELGRTEWYGFTVFWRGQAVHYQHGDLIGGVELMRTSLEILGPESPRRSSILTFYADALTDLGQLAEAGQALEAAVAAAQREGPGRARAYAAWTGARLAASLGDPSATFGHVLEVEANLGDWYETMTGLDYVASAADQLDRVGLDEPARRYLGRARRLMTERGSVTEDGTPQDEPLRWVEASMLARSGDPRAALDVLPEVVRGFWLEKRLLWRHTLLTAWATLRAGGRDDAGILAGRALDQAVQCGGLSVAVAGEPLLTRALAPLADEAGSVHAHALLSDGRRPVIRLFGTPLLTLADGRRPSLPRGRPAQLVRWLAVEPGGVPVNVVLNTFYPEADRTVAQGRLRQVLKLLRREVDDLVVRDGERLTLAAAWVDAREFGSLLERAGRESGSRRLQLTWAAVALSQRGPLLPADPYAEWAQPARWTIESTLANLADDLNSLTLASTS